MSDFLFSFYPWLKALHVMSVISWMAGLFYLPRLFVHHTEQAAVGSDTDRLFQMMEFKLFRLIMRPAMIATWVFGLLMVFAGGVDFSSVWPWVKAVMVIAMTGFHEFLGARRKELADGQRIYTGRQFRLLNEVPTLLMIVIVVMVIVRPF